MPSNSVILVFNMSAVGGGYRRHIFECGVARVEVVIILVFIDNNSGITIDLGRLQCFVAVAEELHFRRAAARLGMAQPQLTLAIQRLESDLGGQLLSRSNRKVELTPAGKALLEEARPLLARAGAAARMVRQLSSGEIGRLRVGFVPWSVMRALPRTLRQFHAKWPGIEVVIDEQMSRSQVEALQDGSLDLGILNRHLIDTTGLELATVETTRLVAAIPSKWPLGKRRSVHLAELADCPFIEFPQHWVPNYFGAFDEACKRAGFKARVAQRVRQPYTMFNLVANEVGIALVQDTARHLELAGVSLVPIEDLVEPFWSEIAMAWLPRRLSNPLRDFIEIMSTVS